MQFQSSAIDDEELVHNAARQGHVFSLEVYLNQNAKCINKLFTYDKSKWTPLLAACFYKHEHVVRMLLTRFKADIEAVGDIFFDFPNNESQLVNGVSSLWVAIAVDNFDIVKLLVEYGGANVKHLTEQHSTTFRIASYNNNIDMARYLVEHGANPYQAKKGNFTNLMLVADRQHLSMVNYLIDELKCDINEQDENSQTALYHAVRVGSVDIVKILLEHGALNIRDKSRKVTPLMRAALFGQIKLVDAFKGYCSDLEWIEARELLAANLAGCIPDIENRNKTIEYLTEAFQLRVSKNLPKLITEETSELFNYRRECETLEQFNQLILSDSVNDLNIEVTLIHQRLLGDMSKDYHHVLRYNGYVQADTNQYHNCLRWWFYTVDLQQRYHITLKKEDLRDFIHIFTKIRENNQMTVPINALLRILKILSDVLSKHDSYENSVYNLRTLLYLITIIAQMLYNQEILIDDRRDLLKSIRCIIRYQYKIAETDSTLLHLCSSSSTEGALFTRKYPCWKTVRLLIDCGADVNALDRDGNTPLHVLVRSFSPWNVLEVINLLCSAGAHLDYVNKKGQIPLELVPLYHSRIIERLKKKMDVIQLKCLCARLIQQQHFSIENIFSTSLVNFVQKH